MLISVIYKNNTYGMIKSKRLDEFIDSGDITKFFRSSGWVTISLDPIRKTDLGSLRERREIAIHQYGSESAFCFNPASSPNEKTEKVVQGGEKTVD